MPGHRVAVRVAAPGTEVAFTANASVVAGRISVFTPDADGGDSGPHRFTRLPVESLGGGRAARVYLRGAMVALLTRGQVLTAVPPYGHRLEELEAWLATGPPLRDEPAPRSLRCLAVGGMQDERAPQEVRLRWGRVALTATLRCAAAEGRPAVAWWDELAFVRGYLLRQFGPGCGDDPAALCREVLELFDLTPAEAAVEAAAWRDLPPDRILHLRRLKNLATRMAEVRPLLAPGPVAEAVDAWSGLRSRLP